jgi:glycosyltransferase involved in cell wall biosynthesis
MVDVAILLPSLAGGGGERVGIFVAEALAAKGWQVDLVVACSSGSLAERPIVGARKVALNAWTEILALPGWLGYLRRNRPRLVIALVHTAQLTAGLGALFHPSIPFVSSFHGAIRRPAPYQWFFRRWFGLGPERRLYRRAAAIHAVSHGLTEEVREALGVAGPIYRTIYNPVTAAGPETAIAPEHEAIFAAPVIMGMGRLIELKNFASLIRAFARLPAPLHLLIAGEGPEREKLQALAAELGVADRLFMPGFLQQPAAYLRRAKVFALTSRTEGLSLVLLEALAAGAACVSTDCPHGPAELLAGGRYGRLVPVNDDAALADALGEALREGPRQALSPDLADHLAGFSPEAIAGHYDQLVRELISPLP